MAHSHTLLQVVLPSVDFLYFPGLDVAADDVSIRSHLSSKSTRKSSGGGMRLGVRLSLLLPGLEATTTGTLGTAQSPTVPTKRIEMLLMVVVVDTGQREQFVRFSGSGSVSFTLPQPPARRINVILERASSNAFLKARPARQAVEMML